MVNIGNKWDNILAGEWDKAYYKQLREFLISEYRTRVIYPNMHDIFGALKHTCYDEVKVVILGQDPYHGQGQAHGLCFSVLNKCPPPSLINIYSEIRDDIGAVKDTSGDLSEWAKQGVLLLNTVLTVRQGQAASHRGKGWESLTDTIISLLNDKPTPIAYLLWGSHAISKSALIDKSKHLVLTAPHPSPLSSYRGFFGCKHFSKANDFLAKLGQEPIVW